MTLLRDQAALDLLQSDLDEAGQGITREALSAAAGTRWPERVVRRLRRAGFVIEERHGRFLLHDVEVGRDDRADTPPSVGKVAVTVDLGAEQAKLFESAPSAYRMVA